LEDYKIILGDTIELNSDSPKTGEEYQYKIRINNVSEKK